MNVVMPSRFGRSRRNSAGAFCPRIRLFRQCVFDSVPVVSDRCCCRTRPRRRRRSGWSRRQVVGAVPDPVDGSAEHGLAAERVRRVVDEHVPEHTHVVQAPVGLDRVVVGVGDGVVEVDRDRPSVPVLAGRGLGPVGRSRRRRHAAVGVPVGLHVDPVVEVGNVVVGHDVPGPVDLHRHVGSRCTGRGRRARGWCRPHAPADAPRWRSPRHRTRSCRRRSAPRRTVRAWCPRSHAGRREAPSRPRAGPARPASARSRSGWPRRSRHRDPAIEQRLADEDLAGESWPEYRGVTSAGRT